MRFPLDLNSIQTRLTVGFVLASVLGIGSLATWMGWRTYQILLASHRDKVTMLGERIEADVTLLHQTVPLTTALNRIIGYRTTGDLVIWIKGTQGELLAQSDTLTMGSWKMSGVADQLQQLDLQEALVLRPMANWYLVICATPLQIEGQTLGTLYVAEDITADQQSFQHLVRNLALVSTLALPCLTLALVLYIRRALGPLRQLNQLAGTVTADTLAQGRLTLNAAPTEVEELARSYNLMLERLAQAWAQQKRLVNNVSHELRTPLTLVQGYLQSTLRRCHTLTDPQREGLEIATAETDNTIRLLQDLLNLARLESGQTPFHLQPTDLASLVQRGVARVLADQPTVRATAPPISPCLEGQPDWPLAATTTAPARPPRIQVQVQAAPLWAKADPERLQGALRQLIDNALRYSDPDPSVTICLSRQGSQAVLQVCDRGPGISLEHQANVFEPFYRIEADRCRTTGGTGLGLTLVKVLVEGMGGTLHLQSAPGQGSTFTITLPIEDHGLPDSPD